MMKLYAHMKLQQLDDIFSAVNAMKGLAQNGQTEQALHLYEQMDVKSEAMNTYVLRTLFEQFIGCGKPTQFERVYYGKTNALGHSFDSRTLELLVICVHRSQKYYQYHSDTDILANSWDAIVVGHGIKPDLNCLSIAALAFSKYNAHKFDELIAWIMNDPSLQN